MSYGVHKYVVMIVLADGSEIRRDVKAISCTGAHLSAVDEMEPDDLVGIQRINIQKGQRVT